jgi:F-type H+-transporting ATPase subunit gamma
MSDSTASLRRKIQSAGDLQSVVRTMKALAASSIGQYEQSVRALADYSRTVELGLSVCFRKNTPAVATFVPKGRPGVGGIGVVVFGSDQGLVGQFNEVVTEFAIKAIAALPRPRLATRPTQVWAVGERVHARLSDAGVAPAGLFAVPGSVEAITPLVGKILIESEAHHARDEAAELHLVYNRPGSVGEGGAVSGAVYAPFSQRLLPLDAQWQDELAKRPWPTRTVPEIIGDHTVTLRAFIRGYLFVSIFRACAESLASENASRLAAMQRADKNIDDLLEGFKGDFHRVRQNGIDEELFDVIAGFEALAPEKSHRETGTTRRNHL